MTLVEAAVESLEAAIAAERAGADRLELCVGLHEGGTTPSADLISEVAEKVRIPIFVLVRSRAGTFVYTDAEIALMRRSVESAVEMGVAGVVVGALTKERGVNIEQTATLVEAAGGLSVTFHRAFDVVTEQADALEQLTDLGVSRVLTSGGAATALEGSVAIAKLRDQSRGRIGILAAGKIREHNVREVIARTGVAEVHGRLTDEPSMRRLVELAHGASSG